MLLSVKYVCCLPLSLLTAFILNKTTNQINMCHNLSSLFIWHFPSKLWTGVTFNNRAQSEHLLKEMKWWCICDSFLKRRCSKAYTFIHHHERQSMSVVKVCGYLCSEGLKRKLSYGFTIRIIWLKQHYTTILKNCY